MESLFSTTSSGKINLKSNQEKVYDIANFITGYKLQFSILVQLLKQMKAIP